MANVKPIVAGPAQFQQLQAGDYLVGNTPPAGDNSTRLATTAYVDAAVAGGGGGIVVETQDSNYTFVAADKGKCKTRSTDNASVIYTIPASTFSAGDVLYVNFMGSLSSSYYTQVTRASGVTLYRAGTKTAVTTAYVYGGGMMTLFFVSPNVVLYSGPGVN